jgi:hypothetical protein
MKKTLLFIGILVVTVIIISLIYFFTKKEYFTDGTITLTDTDTNLINEFKNSSEALLMKEKFNDVFQIYYTLAQTLYELYKNDTNMINAFKDPNKYWQENYLVSSESEKIVNEIKDVVGIDLYSDVYKDKLIYIYIVMSISIGRITIPNNIIKTSANLSNNYILPDNYTVDAYNMMNVPCNKRISNEEKIEPTQACCFCYEGNNKCEGNSFMVDNKCCYCSSYYSNNCTTESSTFKKLDVSYKCKDKPYLYDQCNNYNNKLKVNGNTKTCHTYCDWNQFYNNDECYNGINTYELLRLNNYTLFLDDTSNTTELFSGYNILNIFLSFARLIHKSHYIKYLNTKSNTSANYNELIQKYPVIPPPIPPNKPIPNQLIINSENSGGNVSSMQYESIISYHYGNAFEKLKYLQNQLNNEYKMNMEIKSFINNSPIQQQQLDKSTITNDYSTIIPSKDIINNTTNNTDTIKMDTNDSTTLSSVFTSAPTPTSASITVTSTPTPTPTSASRTVTSDPTPTPTSSSRTVTSDPTPTPTSASSMLQQKSVQSMMTSYSSMFNSMPEPTPTSASRTVTSTPTPTPTSVSSMLQQKSVPSMMTSYSSMFNSIPEPTATSVSSMLASDPTPTPTSASRTVTSTPTPTPTSVSSMLQQNSVPSMLSSYSSMFNSMPEPTPTSASSVVNSVVTSAPTPASVVGKVNEYPTYAVANSGEENNKYVKGKMHQGWCTSNCQCNKKFMETSMLSDKTNNNSGFTSVFKNGPKNYFGPTIYIEDMENTNFYRN